jgi:ubiquinone/menaquinone biosynthesis C-methylase UbiE
MTDQFREDALAYVERYQKTDYFENLLTTAFARMSLRQEQRTGLTILDVGSGAGNSALPLLTLCPQSSLVASDLSVELLVLLKNVLQQQRLHEDCLLLQLNAEDLHFREALLRK